MFLSMKKKSRNKSSKEILKENQGNLTKIKGKREYLVFGVSMLVLALEKFSS